MDEDTRRKVCRLIAGIVVVDDDLDESEDMFIDRMLAQFNLSSDERDALFPIMDTKEAAEEFRSLAPEVRFEALDLLVQAAAIDGHYVDEEKEYLHAVCDVVGITATEIDKRVEELIAGS
jgi:uncharacterized tellurite resistance protein B-like protein